ncbi:hypothetical protein BJ742DRAFT_789028 [Cladochytrium replicatum]|nr:hypothetical protein BJ742DRAFT_789028 [Cladochytrium replicatum]
MSSRITDELFALESIYGDSFSYDVVGLEAYGTLTVQWILPQPVILASPSLVDNEPASVQTIIRFLPPVVIRFRITPEYPEEAPLQLSLECFWLPPSMRNTLRKHLLYMWSEERSESLFLYADFIANDSLDFLNILDRQTGGLMIDLGHLWIGKENAACVDKWEELMQVTMMMIEHDRVTEQLEFDASQRECGICLDTRRGDECLRIAGCNHVYCRGCLKDYFSLLIKEGTVAQVTCPDSRCKKAFNGKSRLVVSKEGDISLTQPPLPDDVLRNLLQDAELFERYLKMSVTKALEGRQDVVYCPRANCQAASIKDPTEEKLVVCRICKYAFCSMCLRTWHGNMNYCKISNFLEVAEQYMQATDFEKTALEQKYGRKVLERIIQQVEDEKESLRWMRDNAQECPTCGSSVEKSEGCNHMTCRVCQTHFCYLCGVYLNSAKPYDHFSSKTSTCYGKLFAGEQWAEEDF